MRLRLGVLAAVLGACIAPSAHADTASATAIVFSAATVAERDAALRELAAAPNDAAATYAAGSAQFFVALEGLGKSLHRHGFDSPQSLMLPLMRLPVPENPDPEPLTYEDFRAILADFRTGIATSAATLVNVPDGAEIGIDVDLTKLGIDLDEDGTIAPDESAAAIMAALAPGGMSQGGEPPLMTFHFDRADGYWLQGYANFLMAQADFWLAHDFRNAFDGSFHMLFPRAGLPLQDDLVPSGMDNGNILSSEWRIADFISFIHYVNWPVVEPDRRRAARTELKEMIRLSRENWKAIRAETDNDREWLPGPQQKGIHALTGIEVGETEVQAWHAALQMAEDLLDGRSLMPHFRITGKGMNMKRFFDEPKTFDLVPIITGPGAVPYLETGRVLTAEEFAAIQRQFGGAGFMTFAIWFN